MAKSIEERIKELEMASQMYKENYIATMGAIQVLKELQLDQIEEEKNKIEKKEEIK